MQDIISYCFKRGNSWYFRKRINAQYTKNNKDIYFKISLKKLLGKQVYYNTILQSNLFTITNYINNNLEIYCFNKENLTLKELIQFTSELISRYENEAINISNDYSNQLNTRIREVEDMRFNALSYVDENSRTWSGHTVEALDREINILKDAYDSNNKPLISQKAREILNRQNIITKEEILKIDYLDIKEKSDFEEALIKKEREILLQDKRNYLNQFEDTKISNSKSEDNILDLLSNHPQLKTLIDNIKHQNEDKTDNWDYLIETFLSEYTNNQSAYRSKEIALIQFKQMMLGDKAFYVGINDKKHYLTEKTILTASVSDIKAIKALLIDLPKMTLTKDYPFMKKWRVQGVIYTIFTAKKLGVEKNLLSGINSKADVIKDFLKFLKISEDKYKDLNCERWNKILTITKSNLNSDDLSFNDKQVLIPLQSEYINGFLLNRYKDKKGIRTGTASRNFTKHTNSSPHIYWSVLLGIYTGARAEELAQLQIKDIQKKIIKDESVYFIDFCITDYDNQSIKNSSSIRRTPIHNNLIELGFLTYVKNRKSINADDLFDLNRNIDLRRKDFQRSFNNEIKKYIKENYKDLSNYRFSFHGLRSHFIAKFIKSIIVESDDELEEKASLKELIYLKKLIGHTAKKFKDDITVNTYFKEDLELLNAKRRINEINFHIEDGFEEIKRLYTEKYGEPVFDLDL